MAKKKPGKPKAMKVSIKPIRGVMMRVKPMKKGKAGRVGMEP